MAMNPYASYLGTREPRDVIETTALELPRLVGRIGPPRLEASPAPGKWSARDILCHLADSEIVFLMMRRPARATLLPNTPPFRSRPKRGGRGPSGWDSGVVAEATV